VAALFPPHPDAAVPYLTVTHKGSHRFEVNVEGHRLIVDEGVAAGGRDAGPTSTELLAASLASCAAGYAESYLTSHGHSTVGLAVACHYRLSIEQPVRVVAIDITVTAPADLPVDRRRGLLKAVEQCMVGNTLRMPPMIHVMVAAPEGSPVG
jgi:putative redox protein